MTDKTKQKEIRFSDFQLDESIMEGLDSMGYYEPTPIQEKGIPIILQKKDLIGCAQTGTGKTAAFLLPIIQNIINEKESGKGINTLIIVPTRELAVQIDQHLQGLSYFTGTSSLAVYGGGDGMSWDQQRNAFEQGADIIVATPGRLIAHLQMGYLKFDKLKHLVLDEADRMLDMGFYDDILKIVNELPKKRQTLLFSATMPREIRKLANSLLQDPEEIKLSIAKPAEGILQAIYKVEDKFKTKLIKELLKEKNLSRVLIFASTKSSVKNLARELKNEGLPVAAIHSDLLQSEREQVLLNFKSAHTNILVATDIVSRGIDIDNIDLVINYHVPMDAEDYVHRVGRTARAKSTGVALTFVNRKDIRNLMKIERLIGSKIFEIKVPETVMKVE
ncbi:MAG: DEAD/DEAH box helicase [Bacteroidales bacterium]|nr:DEAD/DEAH box helicase [Bacteroidales bacterium]